MFDSSRKRVVAEALNERIRAYLRAAMKTNGLGLVAAADRLNEDKGALSNCLSGKPDARAPSVYLVGQMLRTFTIDPVELLLGAERLPEEFYQPGVPDVTPSKFQLRQGEPASPPSDASREGAHPGKRKGSGGGSAA